jgi:hypothetical protein
VDKTSKMQAILFMNGCSLQDNVPEYSHKTPRGNPLPPGVCNGNNPGR